MSEEPLPGAVRDARLAEWHPPHLDAPVPVARTRASKPLSSAVVHAATALGPLGVGTMVASSVWVHHAKESGVGIVLVMLGQTIIGPALAVTGAIILALAKNRRAWTTAAIASLCLTLVAIGSSFLLRLLH